MPAADGTSPGRCPHCGGAVRPDAAWCTQCWADLRPPPEPSPAPEPVLHPEQVAALPLSRPGEAASGGPAAPSSPGAVPGWPCTRCGATNDLALNACAACGSRFLAGARLEEPPLLVLPGVGDLTKLSRAQRLGLAAAVALLAVLLVVVVSLLFG